MLNCCMTFMSFPVINQINYDLATAYIKSVKLAGSSEKHRGILNSFEI